jgi:dihydrodipicolinate synthase/N-acetylneuraminate lyase
MTRHEIIANLRGVFPPVVTPFNRRGDIDEKRFEENLRRYSRIGLGGVVVSGSTGEMPYLAASERLRLVELARRIVRPPELLIVGTGFESTRETLRVSREAAARGADVVLVVTPNYFKSRMDSRVLVAHYRGLADRLTRPLIIYNIPPFTGVRMEPRAIATLARHPNIIGVKESSGDFRYLRSVLRVVPREFRVMTGAAQIILDALKAGSAGGILGQANFVPDLCIGLYEAFCRKRWKEAREQQQRLMPIIQNITAVYGVPGIKAALDLCGYVGGDPRPPLLPVGAGAKRLIRAALHQSREGLAF